METSTIAIDIRLGEDDRGAEIEVDCFKEVLHFNINNIPGESNKIRIDKFYQALRRLHLQPSELAMDLLIVACAAYAADTRINRYKQAQDSWTRRFMLFIPVSDVSCWEVNALVLQEILQFLTGDFWGFEFRSRTEEMVTFTPPINRRSSGMPYQTDTVCLFSGGMDSFIGAFSLLNSGKRPLLVGHSKSADVSLFRNKAYNNLRNKFSTIVPELIRAHIRVDKNGVNKEKEDTERGRSFLFLTIGAICASALNTVNNESKKLLIPENGLITLNLPLTPLRLGAYSTRTTHPYVLNKMQELLNGLNLDVVIENPFEYKTKGEMLRDCGDSIFVASAETMSCSRPATRNANLEGAGHKHCGKCVPCIIRRASLRKAGISDSNQNGEYRLDILSEPVSASKVMGENVMAFKYMINRSETQPNFLKAAIRMTGPVSDVYCSLNVYERGLAEVKDLLLNVKIVD